ncbi:hypothetical protein PAMP_004384 [Pampus punctatissimus]
MAEDNRRTDVQPVTIMTSRMSRESFHQPPAGFTPPASSLQRILSYIDLH